MDASGTELSAGSNSAALSVMQDVARIPGLEPLHLRFQTLPTFPVSFTSRLRVGASATGVIVVWTEESSGILRASVIPRLVP